MRHRFRDLLLPISLFLGACARNEPELPLFDPVGVGFGFDGVLASDGVLRGYDYGGELREPVMVLVFISESYLTAADEQTLFEQSCAAISPFSPPPSPVPLTTDDGSPLYWSYQAPLDLQSHSCAGRVDPEVWGESAEQLWGPYDGMSLGYGLGPMTDALRSTWSEDLLLSLGDAMIASWVALEEQPAQDWTTGILYAYDDVTGQIPTDLDASGVESLIPLSAASLDTPQGFDGAYLQSTPIEFSLEISP